MHEHALHGCHPAPLSSYLKALAVLRLLAEQKDPEAKGWWQDDIFYLRTVCDKSELMSFFCEEYVPTPIVSPWNGNSGFCDNDNKQGLNAILGTTDPRFALYKKILEEIQSWDEIPSYDTVGKILRTLRNALETSRPGKDQDALRALIDAIVASTPPPEALQGAQPQNLTFQDITAISKSKESQYKTAAVAWRNALRKGRTKCSALSRAGTKEALLSLCRTRLPDDCLPWLDAAYAISVDNSAVFNPLLGTGGNEGHLEFSNSYMQTLSRLFLTLQHEEINTLLESALMMTPALGMEQARIGQFDPGRAGGYNQNAGIEADGFKINPWDYILTLEGALFLAGAAAKRNQQASQGVFSLPFTVRFSPVGYSSDTPTENGRSETWLPIWRNPATYVELRYLFSEGRSSVGRKPARSGQDFAKAVATLGVDRGVSGFVRYAYLMRRGKSYVALPAGRFQVRNDPRVPKLQELEPLLRSLDICFRNLEADPPVAYVQERRAIEEARFDCARLATPHTFLTLVRALGRMERQIALRDEKKRPQRPLSGLSPDWLRLCDVGVPEVRLAAALASIGVTEKVGSLRANMTPVDPIKPWQWGKDGVQTSWKGSSLPERLGNALVRRLMDAERLGTPKIPLKGKLLLTPQDVMSFLATDTDDVLLEELLWGFTLIDWRTTEAEPKNGLAEARMAWRQPLQAVPLSRTWCLLKLLHHPKTIREKSFRREPRIAQLLQAGRVEEACEVARRRLRIADLAPFDVRLEEELDPKRLLAALLFPLRSVEPLEKLVLR